MPPPEERAVLAGGKPGVGPAEKERGFADAWQRLAWAWPFWMASPALWLLVLIAVPVGLRARGDGLFPAMATLGIVAHAFATLTSVVGSWPATRLAASGAIVAAGAWGVELLGSTTGYPFGAYHYTPALQPQLGGVPVAIPLAWFMMLLPSWAVADAILDGPRWSATAGTPGGVRWRYRLLHAGLAGLAFTAWDLYLDPQLVSRGLWVWERPGDYFGIPWTNFAGWWLAAGLLTLAAGFLRSDEGRWRAADQSAAASDTSSLGARRLQAARMRLMLVYTLTWAFQALGLGLFWGQPGPALAGFAGMGVFVALAWLKTLRLWT